MTWYLESDEWEEPERELHICRKCLHEALVMTETGDEFNEIWHYLVKQVYNIHQKRIKEHSSREDFRYTGAE